MLSSEIASPEGFRRWTQVVILNAFLFLFNAMGEVCTYEPPAAPLLPWIVLALQAATFVHEQLVEGARLQTGIVITSGHRGVRTK